MATTLRDRRCAAIAASGWPIQALLMLAAVSTTPERITLGKAMPTGSARSNSEMTSAMASSISPVVPCAGVVTLRRVTVKSPPRRSTTALLIDDPPTSTPMPSKG
jgi:hypothetical protein